MIAKEDLKKQRISVLIHSAAAVIVGIISPLLGAALYALGVVIVIAVLTGRMTQKVVGKQKFNWWVANGLFVYIFVWVDMWIFVANYF